MCRTAERVTGEKGEGRGGTKARGQVDGASPSLGQNDNWLAGPTFDSRP